MINKEYENKDEILPRHLKEHISKKVWYEEKKCKSHTC